MSVAYTHRLQEHYNKQMAHNVGLVIQKAVNDATNEKDMAE